MNKDWKLNERSTKKEIEDRFANARHVMDDLCRAYYGMTWDEQIKCLGRREGIDGERGDWSKDKGKA